MSKRSLVLSFVAVIALFAFQVHLIRKGQQSAKAEFDHLIAIRANQVGEELEKHYYCFQSEAQQFIPSESRFFLLNPINGAGISSSGDTMPGKMDTLLMHSMIDSGSFKRYGFDIATRANIRFDFEFLPIDSNKDASLLNPIESFVRRGYRNSLLNAKGERLLDTVVLDSLITEHIKSVSGAERCSYSVIQDQELVYSKAPPSNQHWTIEPTGTLYKSRLLPQLYLKLHLPKRPWWSGFIDWPMVLAALAISGMLLLLFARNFQFIRSMTRLSELKSDFINMMTHEFNTPITNLKLTIDNYDDKLSFEKKNKLLTIVNTEIDRLGHNIRTLFEINRLSSNELRLEEASVSVHQLLEMTGDAFEASLEENNTAIKWRLNAQQDTVKADKVHLLNVFTNLIDNALKYAVGTPKIEISSSNKSGNIQIMVKDEGIGMGKEQIKQAFDKYFRSDELAVRTTKGMGLGLFYSKKIIQLHGGSIELKSTKGKWTTVGISLPLN